MYILPAGLSVIYTVECQLQCTKENTTGRSFAVSHWLWCFLSGIVNLSPIYPVSSSLPLREEHYRVFENLGRRRRTSCPRLGENRGNVRGQGSERRWAIVAIVCLFFTGCASCPSPSLRCHDATMPGVHVAHTHTRLLA